MRIIEIARQLRKRQTEAEALFWIQVRNRKLQGLKFFRQYPISCDFDGNKKTFVADFYCAECKLVVELDGKIHEQQKEHDKLRTILINQKGISVMRFTNDQITQDMQGILSSVIDCISSSSPLCLRQQEREGLGVSK